MEKDIIALSEKSEKAETASESLKYAQAAYNLAEALRIIRNEKFEVAE